MAMNKNVSNAATAIAEAYGTDSYLEAKENYFTILEEEYTKDPKNGWIGLEDPVDCLIDSMVNGAPAKWVRDVLTDYIRLHEIIKKVDGTDPTYNTEVVEEATAYIRLAF